MTFARDRVPEQRSRYSSWTDVDWLKWFLKAAIDKTVLFYRGARLKIVHIRNISSRLWVRYLEAGHIIGPSDKMIQELNSGKVLKKKRKLTHYNEGVGNYLWHRKDHGLQYWNLSPPISICGNWRVLQLLWDARFLELYISYHLKDAVKNGKYLLQFGLQHP